MFFSIIEITLKQRDTCVVFELDVAVAVAEVFGDRVDGLLEDKGRIFNGICGSFWPEGVVLDDDLVQWIDLVCSDLVFQLVVDINALFEIFDVLG